MNKIISNLIILVLILAIIPVVNALECELNDEPNYGTGIIIDGDETEWTQADLFAKMYEAGKVGEQHPHFANLYLRYNCTDGILYALVWAEDDNKIDTEINRDNHFIKIGQTGKLVDANNASTEFQFINEYSGVADGWEARVILDEGCYSHNNSPENGLNVHAQVIDSKGDSQTARPSFDPTQIDLYIDCCEIPIPEFPTVALPIAAILGIMFILQSRRRKED